MLRLFTLAALLLVSLSGCQSQGTLGKGPADRSSMGWHCEVDQAAKEVWRCDKKSPGDNAVFTTAPPGPKSASAATPATDAMVNADLASLGYSLQLGAYGSRQKAREVAENLDLEGDVQVREILVNGRTFAIILWGQYASRDAAEAAAQALTINYWVRSMRSVADATVRQ